MNLQPTQVYNWFANYRRRQKSCLPHTEKLNNSCPERALTYPTKEQQDKGSYTPQTAGLSLPNGLRMWSRKLKNNFQFPREGKDIVLQNSIYILIKWTLEDSTSVECLIVWLEAVTPQEQGQVKRDAHLQNGYQMKANTWEAAGFSSQILRSGQHSSKTQYFHAPSRNLDQTSVTGNKRVLLNFAN